MKQHLGRQLLKYFAAVSIVGGLLALPNPASAAPLPKPASAAPLNYYALGDSYSAGNDAGQYYSKPTSACQRSADAYPVIFAKSTGSNIGTQATSATAPSHFVACSGATMNNISGPARQYPTEPPGQRNVAGLAKANLITVKIGGNDVGGTSLGFGNILADCVDDLTTTCDQKYGWIATSNPNPKTPGIPDLLGPLYNTYLGIKAKAPTARIIVLTYPQIFAPSLKTCGGTNGISTSEMSWIRARWTQLNDVIMQAASDAGVGILQIENLFKGHY